MTRYDLSFELIIARIPFVDGTARDVYLGPDGHQYVFGDDGQPVAGVWLMREGMDDDGVADMPLIVEH